MSQPEDIPDRVTRLEYEVAQARQDAAAARILAGGADRDVSEMHAELRAHTSTLDALRETQVEQGHEIRELRSEMRDGFAGVDERFAEVRAEMRAGDASLRAELRAEMREGFATVAAGIAQINARLTTATDES